jgi:hypothetical protein
MSEHRPAPLPAFVAKMNSEQARLDAVADVVLAYRPKPKTKAAKRRIRRNKRAMKAKDKPKSRE